LSKANYIGVVLLSFVACATQTNVTEKSYCDVNDRPACDPSYKPDAATPAETTPPLIEDTTKVISKCPADMVYIEGDYCPVLEEICLKWLDNLRCVEFKNPTVCRSAKVHMSFCIDTYEAPNQLGIKPTMQVTWYEAKASCESQGKRLCVDNEWTQACRGPNNLPYPYGYFRDDTACRIDQPWQDPATHTFEQLDKTVASGSMERCVSEYGVHDMTGNADEFCQSSGGSPYQSVLKGGHPHSVRNACSPRTTAHNESFSYYVTSFRCCKDSDK